MLNEVEKKIKKQRQRLELQPSDTKLASLVPPQYSRHEEKIQMLTEKINKLVSEAEELGTKGQVEEAQGIMKLCDKLKDERDQLRRQNEGSVWHQVGCVGLGVSSDIRTWAAWDAGWVRCSVWNQVGCVGRRAGLVFRLVLCGLCGT